MLMRFCLYVPIKQAQFVQNYILRNRYINVIMKKYHRQEVSDRCKRLIAGGTSDLFIAAGSNSSIIGGVGL